MTSRLARRLVFSVAVFVPMIVMAMAQSADLGEQTPAKLSITTDTTSPFPAKLYHRSGNALFTAEGQTVKVTYTASRLMIEMTAGSLQRTNRTVPFRSATGTPFKVLYLTVETNGNITSYKIE